MRISNSVFLRPFKDEDAGSLAKHANNPKISGNLNDGFPSPYTLQDAREFIQRRKEERTILVLAIEVNGEAAGAIGIFPQQNIQRKCAEIGYWISEDHWGKGICTVAVKFMVRYAFSNFDLIRLYGRPFPYNIASQKVLEKCGFKLEAILKDAFYKDEKIYDEWIYSLLKKDSNEDFS